MKTIIISLMLCCIAILQPKLEAQAWSRNSQVITVGAGLSRFLIYDDYYYGTNRFHNGYGSVTSQLNIEGEFGIHPYVGLGFTTGIGGRNGSQYGYDNSFNVPIGLIANFHFYQLISDKTGGNMAADKLDIYAGANLGSGFAALYNTTTTRVSPLIFAGFQGGLRYYFIPRMAINAEVGWGKSIITIGLVFKM